MQQFQKQSVTRMPKVPFSAVINVNATTARYTRTKISKSWQWSFREHGQPRRELESRHFLRYFRGGYCVLIFIGRMFVPVSKFGGGFTTVHANSTRSPRFGKGAGALPRGSGRTANLCRRGIVPATRCSPPRIDSLEVIMACVTSFRGFTL